MIDVPKITAALGGIILLAGTPLLPAALPSSAGSQEAPHGPSRPQRLLKTPGGKEVWISLKTSHHSVAEAKLARFLEEHRERVGNGNGEVSAK